jgi:hypothetical protein
VLRLDMVDKSTSLSKPTSGWMFVIGQSGQAFSSQSEAPSESCWHMQPPPRDMILHPHLASCLSSGNLWQWAREHLTSRPSSVGSSRCHGWGPLPILLRQTVAPSCSRLHEPHPQRGMGAYKMIIRSPPFQVSYQVWRLLRRRPGTASQRGYSMSDGQIHPLNPRVAQRDHADDRKVGVFR